MSRHEAPQSQACPARTRAFYAQHQADFATDSAYTSSSAAEAIPALRCGDYCDGPVPRPRFEASSRAGGAVCQLLFKLGLNEEKVCPRVDIVRPHTTPHDLLGEVPQQQPSLYSGPLGVVPERTNPPAQ